MKIIFIFLLTTLFAVDYESQIQPIFDANCGACHLENSSGDLNLSNYDNLMSSDVVVPGNHQESDLWDRIRRPESAPGDMPPTGALTQGEIDLIADWIDAGALAEEPIVTVTFNVNMSAEDVGFEGPTLWMGEFYPEAGFIMTDDDGDGIWSYTVELDPGTYTYKYRNGWWTEWNEGGGWEEVPEDCAFGDWSDRQIVVANESIDLDIVCFGSCEGGECEEHVYSNVTFQVDMSFEELGLNDIVYVNGSFNNWCGICNPMSDEDGDGVYTLTIEIAEGSYEYLFTTNGWYGLQGGAPIGSECDFNPTDSYGNYGFNLEQEDLILGPYCFGSCNEECLPPAVVDVTFQIDMSFEDVSGSVYMLGTHQIFPFSTALFPTEMFDEDGDNIYTVTIELLSDQMIEYKFVNGDEAESDIGLGGCGNNTSSSCNSPELSSDCNNREYTVPSCIQGEDDENGNATCELDPQTVDSVYFNFCPFTNVNITIDLNGTGYPNDDYSQCGINGSWNAEGDAWVGWGLELFDDDEDGFFSGTLEDLAPGDYEFIVFCSGEADDSSGWGQLLGAPVGSECDFNLDDEYGNYGFTVPGIDSSGELPNVVEVAYCAGECSETCGENSCGDGICAGSETCSSCPSDCGDCHTVTFDLDGLEDCGFISVTGSFDNWSGWGAHTDNGMMVELTDGSYEFIILCVDTSINEWWNDIWGSSIEYSAPLGSSCDFIADDEYSNYGFLVDGSDLTVSYCAGSCEATCEECQSDGDVNSDSISNVVDIVLIVSHVLGTSSLDEDVQCYADLNGDGIINVVDIVLLVSSILG